MLLAASSGECARQVHNAQGIRTYPTIVLAFGDY